MAEPLGQPDHWPFTYSVHVNGPWCLTFGWEAENAVDVVLENHHRGVCPIKTMTRCPTHPGEILREDSLPAMGLSVAAFARDLWLAEKRMAGHLPKTFESLAA